VLTIIDRNATRLGIVPADFVMSRDLLHGVRQRAEDLARSRAAAAMPVA
jgi:hypothetical protein